MAFYVELSGWRAKLKQDRRLAGSGLPVSVFIRVSANLHTSVRPAQNSAQDHTKCLLMARSKPFLVLGLTWSLKFLQRWYVGRDKNKRSRFPAVTPLSAQFFFEHPPIVAISIDQTHTFSFVSQRNFARFRKKNSSFSNFRFSTEHFPRDQLLERYREIGTVFQKLQFFLF